MAKENRVLVLIIGFLCAWILLSAPLKKAACESAIPSGVLFSGDSNAMYFFDRENAKVYRYNTQGRLTRLYTITELGKILQLK